MARHLLERISWLIRDSRKSDQEKVKIIFSNRKQIKIDRINKYINILKLDKKSQIDWSTIENKIDIKNHNQIAGLQFADIFATAFRRFAFEGDRYGVETIYMKILKPFLYKRKNQDEEKIENYGIKIRGLKISKLQAETKELILREFKFNEKSD